MCFRGQMRDKKSFITVQGQIVVQLDSLTVVVCVWEIIFTKRVTCTLFMAYLNCNYVCSVYISSGGLAHLQNKNVLMTNSPQCHPRCSCLSFFSRKEIA